MSGHLKLHPKSLPRSRDPGSSALPKTGCFDRYRQRISVERGGGTCMPLRSIALLPRHGDNSFIPARPFPTSGSIVRVPWLSPPGPGFSCSRRTGILACWQPGTAIPIRSSDAQGNESRERSRKGDQRPRVPMRHQRDRRGGSRRSGGKPLSFLRDEDRHKGRPPPNSLGPLPAALALANEVRAIRGRQR